MNRRVTSLQISSSEKIPGRRRSSTDIIDYSGGRNKWIAGISTQLKKLGMGQKESHPAATSNNDASSDEPVDHFIEIVLATKENTSNVGWFICDAEDCIDEEVHIPFYANVTEGGNFDQADWKDQPVVRQAKVSWRDDPRIAWLERHMEMTQGFILIGKNPGLMILGEPTHDREDLSEEQRCFPDISRLKGYLIPAGCGIIIKKGTWHDFPVSLGPDVNVFLLNTKEVVDALMSMDEPSPMDFGDCYKIRNSDAFQDFTLRFPDPRPMANALGLLPNDVVGVEQISNASTSTINNCKARYGDGMTRVEVPPNWAGSDSGSVWVVPVINVEAFSNDEFGSSVQPHLNRVQPEIANRGWRDYGNNRGLARLGSLFKQHDIPCTAVVSSDLVQDESVLAQLHRLKHTCGWEIGAHGTNNSTGGHAGLTTDEERNAISRCIKSMEAAFGSKNATWLTPGFSVTCSTPKLLLASGVGTLLDFVDDDAPFLLEGKEATDKALVCLPYSMETNDFSLILERKLSPREYAAALESHILQLAKESRESGRPTVVCLGMHTFVAGVPAVVHELDKVLSRLRHTDNIEWATAERISCMVKNDNGGVEESTSTRIVSPFEAQGAINDVIENSRLSDQGSLTAIPAVPSPVQVNLKNTGLLLIDMQNDFMSRGGFGESLGNEASKLGHIIAPTKAVLQCARSAGLTIIHTREGHRSNLADLTHLKASGCTSIGTSSGKGRSLVRGDWGGEFIPELAPERNETIIDKPGKGAFFMTDLDLILRNADIDTLIVCGVTTEVCVHSTVREAADRGIKCIVLKDCCASYFEKFHEVGMEMIAVQGGIFGSVTDSQSIKGALKGRLAIGSLVHH